MDLLPNEILFEVMKKCDLKTLKNLKCVNSLFHELFWDEHFSKVRWTEKLLEIKKKKSSAQCLKWATFHKNKFMIGWIIKEMTIFDVGPAVFLAVKKGDIKLVRMMSDNKISLKYFQKSRRFAKKNNRVDIMFALEYFRLCTCIHCNPFLT